ncbi:MAG: sensor histidine kinase [Candidatus Sumerlaeia bacterium]
MFIFSTRGSASIMINRSQADSTSQKGIPQYRMDIYALALNMLIVFVGAGGAVYVSLGASDTDWVTFSLFLLVAFAAATSNLRHLVLGRMGRQKTMEENPAQMCFDQEPGKARSPEAEYRQFLYAISHDLREPLRKVRSYMQLVQERYGNKLDEQGRGYVDIAIDGSGRMQKMLDALLTYSRIDSRGGEFEPVDMEEVVTGAIDNLESMVQKADAEIHVGSLYSVVGDEGQLMVVVQNLLMNALKYRSEERPLIKIDMEQDAKTTKFYIQDNGIGIEAKDQGKVFQIFQRLHSRLEYAGSGMGLAFCRKIIKRHGGDIWVESEPGKGSLFCFQIPRTNRISNASNIG